MTLDLPTDQADREFHQRSQEYSEAIQKALEIFKSENDPSKESEWEDAGERDEVKLYKKTNPENPAEVPIVKGVAIIENATPSEVLATIQLPGMRKKWDPRFDEGFQLERYSSKSFLFYSVMKSPSYFIWARDIVGVQENQIKKDGDEIVVIQTSVSADQYVDEAGSYSKSRTRATLDVSCWQLVKDGENCKVEYVVKIHLNGALPTSIVSTIATETPMCVARARDVYYTAGHAPYEVGSTTSDKEPLTNTLYAEFVDGDGTEATSGEKAWKAYYLAQGADKFSIRFDGRRMYSSGAQISVTGEAASDVKAEVDEATSTVNVEVAEEAKGKKFSLALTPK
ncbi:Bet v1-like protein [Violaceomyces palustris]|uniref:Bet v1-like protein n=1 Tax=Violaceomyces palustris TaxID=1673888 RepID=A0ACD0NYG9_9BASI|nr:Bet v1-like protein [Violaceomyces palustris]